MKHSFTLFIILSFYTFCYTQNLVPNPSFEEYDTCPDFAGQIHRANGWYSAKQTPDYFNSCAPGLNWCTIPLNYFGHCLPASGISYSGIIAKWGGNTDLTKEYIGAQLLSPLQIGVKYYASFKVQLGGESSSTCGINKLGILFSTTGYNTNAPAPSCNNCAQIYSDSIVADTLNWTRLSGSFVADSAYSYICIGRFNFNAYTDSILLSGTQCGAYYYLDDVCISSDSAYSQSYSYSDIAINISDIEVLIYPNPATDFLIMEFTDARLPLNLHIYDELGRTVYIKSDGISSVEHVPIAMVDSNLLFATITFEDSVHTQKIIKQTQ